MSLHCRPRVQMAPKNTALEHSSRPIMTARASGEFCFELLPRFNFRDFLVWRNTSFYLQGIDKEFNKVLATRISDGWTLKRTSKNIGSSMDWTASKARRENTHEKQQVDSRLDELFINYLHYLHLLFVRCLDSFSALYQFIRKSSIIRECYRQLPALQPFHRTTFNFPNFHLIAFYLSLLPYSL